MFEKIPINKLYVANYVDETLEYIYGGIYKSTSIIHHFNLQEDKDIFMIVTDQEDKVVGYMNLFDKKIYRPMTASLEDYEVVFDGDISDMKQLERTTDGYINFEPLANYNSKFIKPLMTVRTAKKAINDINKQKEEIKIKSLVFKN